jgi:photosystem II stability/assembly factor-like uncharacterized protein
MKTNALLILMSMIVFVSTGQDPQWVQQSSPISDDFVALSIIDDQHLWIASASGSLLYTDDGGENWVVQNTFPQMHFESICFSDPEHGCVVGWREAPGGTVIMMTSDGGQNWQDVDHPEGNCLYDVFFINNNRGWAVGIGGQTGWIIFSDDGGMTWDRQMEILGVSGELYSVHFRDELKGNICGVGGTFLLTASAGASGNGWAINISIPSIGKDLYDLWNYGPTDGWAVGQDGVTIYTNDSWANWTESASGTDQDLNAVHGDRMFGKAWAVGNAGTILYHSGWILPWEPQSSGVEEDLNDVGFVDADLGWAVGDNGTILKFTIGGFDVEEAQQLSFSLYPNPCKDMISLRYRMPDARCRIIELMDISGRWIREVARQEVGPGEDNIEIDVSDLPPGVYLLRMQVGEEAAVKKIVVRD